MVEIRLAETLRAFAVLDAVNRRFIEDDGLPVRRSISDRSGFWGPVTLGLQATVLTGIVALLDKRRNDCATFYHLFERLTPRQLTRVPFSLRGDLDSLRARYGKYRHKLFAHNDMKRLSIAEAFDRDGFTWISISADLMTLDYAAKVFGHAMADIVAPSLDEARSLLSSFNLAEVQSRQHSQWFLREVVAPAEHLIGDPTCLTRRK